MLRNLCSFTTAEYRAKIWPGPPIAVASVPSMLACANPEFFFRGGPTLTTSFSVDERREDPSTTISRPMVAQQ